MLRATVGQMVICTYARPAYAEEALSSHGLAPFFDLVRCYTTPQDCKRDMVRDLLDRSQCRPAIVIGDRRVDIEAAHGNGLHAIGVLYGYGSAEEMAMADAVASTPPQLPDLAQRLLRDSRPD